VRCLALAATLIAIAAPPASASVQGWGENSHGQLGAGYRSLPQNPVGTAGLPANVKTVAAAGGTSYALLDDGTVRAWGGNTYGQLGDGTHTASTVPVQVKIAGVTQIAASRSHVIARLSDGTVAVWGSNLNGELGNGTTTHGRETKGDNSPVPLIVPNLQGVVAVATGGPDNVALLSDGTLMAWGENGVGEVGDGTRVEKTVPTRVRGLSGVKAVAIGGFSGNGGHMLALLNDGTVRAVGGNGSGQLGDGTNSNSLSFVTVRGLSGVTQVAADASNSLALREDGTVLSWGSNSYGQLGVGAGPEACPYNPCSRVPVTLPVRSVTAISLGFRFGLAISNGKPFAWGWNTKRQLGDGTTVNRSLPVPVTETQAATAVSAGSYDSLAIVRGGTPPPNIWVTPGVGLLTLGWRAGTETGYWHVAWRPVTYPASRFGRSVTLPPSARSFTIPAPGGQPVELRLQDMHFGPEMLAGTALF
jgi:alpha-tubulin suppressor-like RCC1 family protein